MHHRAALLGLVWLAGLLALARPALATSAPGTPLPELGRSAATVVRGICLSAEPRTRQVAGATVPITHYTFRVLERLKGSAGETFSFHQVGHPEGSGLDLGTLAGLPVYRPGGDYVLFLLPESRYGLTSPSGAGEGAFQMSQGRAIPLRGGAPTRLEAGTATTVAPLTLDALRAAARGEGNR